jgi:putative intracellular protease/amidase
MNPDVLRIQPKAVAFVKAAFYDVNKPISVICHGPWTVIETGAARGYPFRRGHLLRLIFEMPALNGWTRKLCSMEI